MAVSISVVLIIRVRVYLGLFPSYRGLTKGLLSLM